MMRKIRGTLGHLLIAVIATNCFVISILAETPTAPARLLVDGVSEPLAIDRDSTRFTWMSADTRRGARQTAYQILVASSADSLSAGKADWWDSGKVESDKSASVEYGGKPSPPGTRLWWKVRIWDETGESSAYSTPAYFDTGLNHSASA